VTVVRLSGDLDLSTVPRLRAALIDLDHRGHHHLELDLRLVDFLDSAGLGVLLGAVRRARLAGGDARVVAIAPVPARLVEILGLAAVLGLAGAAEAAGAGPAEP
jgi:anti-sigma B factor antagonist